MKPLNLNPLVPLIPLAAIAFGLIIGYTLIHRDGPGGLQMRKVTGSRLSFLVGYISGPRRHRPVDPAEEADLRHHHSAIDRCNAEHRLAVIGYGWKIIWKMRARSLRNWKP